MRKTVVALSLSGMLFVSACGGSNTTNTGEEISGSNTGESASTDSGSESSDATSEPSEDAGPSINAFGDQVITPGNIAVTVGEPMDFTPGEFAAADEANAYRSFEVTVVNQSEAPYDPNGFFVTMQSGNQEASQVFDSEQLGDAPTTSLLPGREATFTIAFGVNDPEDLVMEVQADVASFNDSIIYATQ